MKTTFKKNITALATFALFAPLASAQFWDIRNDGTGVGDKSAIISDYVTSSWQATKQDVDTLSTNNNSLDSVTSLETNINNFVSQEEDYKNILNVEVEQNDDTIVLNEVAVDAANSDVADADLLVNAADGLVNSSTISRDDALASVDDILGNDPSIDPLDPVTHTTEYTAAVDALDDFQAALDTNLLAQTAATNSQAAASVAQTGAIDALQASNDRAVALSEAIDRSTARITAAGDAWNSIDTAVTEKEDEFTELNDAMEAFADGIMTGNLDGTSTVNDLDEIIDIVDNVVTDDGGIDDPVDLAFMPTALDGSALSTTDLAAGNDPETFANIITEATDALDTVDSNLTAEFQSQLKNALGNGAFEREAVTDLAGGLLVMNDGMNDIQTNGIAGIITKEADGIHIGTNSFILDDTAGNHVLTTDDGSLTLGGGAVLEVEVDGRLDVSGNLEIGAIPDVESAINNNFSNITVNSVISGINVGNITANTGAITTLNDDATVEGSVAHSINALATGAVATNTGAVATNTGNIGANTGSITTLNDNATVTGSVANSIAAAISDLGTSANGIAGVIERKNINGESVIQLGANTFLLNDATDTISTTSGNINLDADVAITGDLEVAGDVFVGGRSIGLQSQINSNRLDIDRNARGIAMVAALQHTTVLPGMTNALDVSAAHFEGETGFALNYARRISENVQLNFGAASTTDFDESVIKAGVGVQW